MSGHSKHSGELKHSKRCHLTRCVGNLCYSSTLKQYLPCTWISSNIVGEHLWTCMWSKLLLGFLVCCFPLLLSRGTTTWSYLFYPSFQFIISPNLYPSLHGPIFPPGSHPDIVKCGEKNTFPCVKRTQNLSTSDDPINHFVNTTTTWHATSLRFPCVESKLGRGVHPLPAVVQRMAAGVCNKDKVLLHPREPWIWNLKEVSNYLPRNMNPFISPSIQVQVPTLPTWFNKSRYGHHHLIINLHWTHCWSHRSSGVHGDLRHPCSFWGEAELGPPWVFAGNLVSMLWQMFFFFWGVAFALGIIWFSAEAFVVEVFNYINSINMSICWSGWDKEINLIPGGFPLWFLRCAGAVAGSRMRHIHSLTTWGCK